MANSSNTLTSDVALFSILFPLFVLFILSKTAGPISWSDVLRHHTALPSSKHSDSTSTSPTTGPNKGEGGGGGGVSGGPFSLPRALRSYAAYRSLSLAGIASMQLAYSSLGRRSRRIGEEVLGYSKKLERARLAVGVNDVVVQGIMDVGEELLAGPLLPREETPASPSPWLASFKDILASLAILAKPPSSAVVGGADLGRVREALKHFIRDWSDEGAEERRTIFTPILDVLGVVPQAERGRMKVLVPGSGLGRLAWEASQLGFTTTANELSFYMTLALRFLLAPAKTQSANQHTLRPYAHWFSHQRSNDALFRSVAFPDVVPRLGDRFKLLEKDFMSLRPSTPIPIPLTNATAATAATATAADITTSSQSIIPFWKTGAADGGRSTGGEYDFVLTLFFIDTSLDVFSTLEQIFTLLKPGGTWVNLGPLLWTSGASAKVELSLEEVMRVVAEIGFIVEDGKGEGEGGGGRGGGEEEEKRRPRTVECEYTRDREAMMRWTYKAEFWVARKPKI